MSYYIVRDLKVIPNPCDETGVGHILQYTVADSNCFNINYDRNGRRYETHCEYSGTTYVPTEENNFRHFTKEEIEKAILVSYFKGNYHCGNNKYNRFIKKVGLWFNETSGHHPLLDRYYELDKKLDKIHRRLWKCKEGSKLRELFTNVSNKLYDEKNKFLEDTLYYMFLNQKKLKISETMKCKPFILKDDCGRYVVKMNRATYKYTYYRDNAKVFTDVRLHDKYKDGDRLFTVIELESEVS